MLPDLRTFEVGCPDSEELGDFSDESAQLGKETDECTADGSANEVSRQCSAVDVHGSHYPNHRYEDHHDYGATGDFLHGVTVGKLGATARIIRSSIGRGIVRSNMDILEGLRTTEEICSSRNDEIAFRASGVSTSVEITLVAS